MKEIARRLLGLLSWRLFSILAFPEIMLFQLFACTFDAGVSVVIQASLRVAYRALGAFFETLNVAPTQMF